MSTAEEEAERLAMRESLASAIRALADLDAETVRRLSEAFVDHFDARHADLRLLDLEYRLGLASEEALLKAYHDVAYLDAATTLGGVALTTTLARLGVGVARLSPRAARVGLRSAALRFDGMIAMRSATVDRFVARRFAELAMQGHGPQRHEGAVTRQMLIDRVLRGIDPMTGTRIDGVNGGRHVKPRVVSRITSPEVYVAAESVIRRSPEYRAALEAALHDPLYRQDRQGRFVVTLEIQDVLGAAYRRVTEGLRRVGNSAVDVDFEGGTVVAIFPVSPDGEPPLFTMYPDVR